jgi:hypothetical protein
MSTPHLKPVAAVALAATLIEFAGTHSAAAQNVSGPMALALAAVVAQHSPLVDAANKRIIASLFAGDSKVVVPAGKTISVMADSIVCRISNVEITARSCELTFGSAKRNLKGREANEIYATLAAAGVPSDGAAGSIFESVMKLSCALDPAAIKKADGSGAMCEYAPKQ